MQSITDRQLLILQQSAGLWCFSQEAFFWLVVSFRSSARIFAAAPRIAATKADLRLEPFPRIGTAVPLFLATVVTSNGHGPYLAPLCPGGIGYRDSRAARLWMTRWD
jgi:hypothetical protein